MGHQAGDQVLREVAAHLRRSVRATDTLARLGGDEFIIVATDLDVGQSLDHFMESVRGAMDKPIQVEGESMVVSASMGMAIYPDDADDSIKLLRVADQRMYALKRRPEFSPKAVKSAVVGFDYDCDRRWATVVDCGVKRINGLTRDFHG